MVRIGKKQERRNISPRKHRYIPQNTTEKKETVGFSAKVNALDGEIAKKMYIPKVK